MELRVLKYFLAVAQFKNISAAADSLGLTQPTLSRQLKEFEEQLGCTLMIRGARRISLTEEGELLKKRAVEILDLVERTEEEVSACSDARGDVFIGAGETLAMKFVAAAAVKIRSSHPDVRFNIVSADAEDVCWRLDKGLLDFGLLIGGVDSLKYDFLKLSHRDVWGVLLRAEDELAARRSITPEDAAGVPLILSRQSESRRIFKEWMGPFADEMISAGSYNLVFNASIMVEQGLGAAAAIDGLVDAQARGLVFRPLEPPVEMPVFFVWKKDRMLSRTDKTLIETVKLFSENLQKTMRSI